MKSLITLIALFSLAGCAEAVTFRPISYPWMCEIDRTRKNCVRLGYEVTSDEPAVVLAQASELCLKGAKSIVMDEHRHRTLIICQ